MKLRMIVTVLAAVAVFSAAGSGYLYYRSLTSDAVKKAAAEVEKQGMIFCSQTQAFLQGHLRSAAVVAGLSQVVEALKHPGAETLERLNPLLDHVRDRLGVEVCYLMDRSGVTVASSNRSSAGSFVGKNYGFRDYFSRAIGGDPAVYMARGVTSGKRGIYYSHPVRIQEAEPPAGVLVIKESVALLKEKYRELSMEQPGVSLLTGPRGVVFLASDPEWEGKLLWPLAEAELAAVAAERQFGAGPWPWSGLSRENGGSVEDRSGTKYLVHHRPLPQFPGWDVVYLVKLDDEIGQVVASLRNTVSQVSLVMLFVVGVSALLLYSQASKDIRHRKSIMQALEEREERLGQILDSIQAGVLIVSEDTHEIVDVNRAAATLIGASKEQLVGQVCHRFVCPAEVGKCPITDLEQSVDNSERTLLRADGSQLTILKTVSHIQLDGEKHLLETFIDVSELKKAKQALEEEHARLVKSERTLSKAQKIASVGHWEWEPDTNTVLWSEEFARIVGIVGQRPSAEILAGRIHPDDREAWWEQLKQALKTGGQFVTECRGVRMDGDVIWIRIEAEVHADGNNAPHRVFGIVQDISDRKRWEETIRQQRDFQNTLMETLPNALYYKDIEGRYTGCNAAFESYHGRHRSEIIGKTALDLLPKETAEFYQQKDLELLENPGTQQYQSREKMPDGGCREVVFDKATLHDKDGRTTGLIGIVSDVTEVVEARQKAEEASRAKSEFLANMSHEIRTPMNGVIGMADLALGTDLTEEQRDYLETIKQSAENLMTIINSILDFSKIESGRLEMEEIPFHLRSTLEDAADILVVPVENKGLELICDIRPGVPAQLRGDPGKLRQILVNLGGNAVKFTETGEVLLQCRVENSWEGRIRLHFSVSDTGVGIPEDKLETVFESFRQADGSMTRKFGGTGLGLSISKSYAEAMGGRMWVESRVGEGSIFHFTAEFGVVEEAPAAEPPPPAELAGKRVLVVDDSETNRRILREMAAAWKMDPEEASGGGEAIERFEQAAAAGRPYDLLLLDLQMPGMEGFEVSRAVRSRTGLPQPRILLLTSAGRRGDAAKCREFGVEAYLIKPIKKTDLHEAVGMVLSAPQDSQSLQEQGPVTRHRIRERRWNSGRRILLAEDDAINRKVAVHLLERIGHQVVVAEDGEEAIAKFNRQHFDLILMDVQMPKMDGLAATRELRQAEKKRGGRIPIVAMTAHAVKGDREKCLGAGMDDYLSKPIQADKLEAMIGKWAGKRNSTPPPDSVGGAAAEEGGQAEGDLPVDMEKAMEQVMGNAPLLDELLAEFHTQLRPQLASLAGAVEEKDGERLRREAHRLKGTAANLWARPIADACLALEKAGNEGDLDGAASLVEALEVQIGRFEAFFESLEHRKAAGS